MGVSFAKSDQVVIDGSAGLGNNHSAVGVAASAAVPSLLGTSGLPKILTTHSKVSRNFLWQRQPHPHPASPELRLRLYPIQFLQFSIQRDDTFVPSRHRSPSAVQLTTSGGLQQCGRALPALLLRGLTPDDHWFYDCNYISHLMTQLRPLPPSWLWRQDACRIWGPR